MEHLSNFDEIKNLLSFNKKHEQATFPLADLSASIWENKLTSQLISQNKEAFETSKKFDIIKFDEDGLLAFSDRLSFEFYYAIAFARQTCFSGSQWKDIFQQLWQKMHRQKSAKGYQLSWEFDALFLIAINNFLNINVLQLWINDFDLYKKHHHSLDKALPYLKVQLQDLMAFLIAAKNDNVSHFYSIALALNNLSAEQPQLGYELLNEIDNSQHIELKNIVPGILKGLSRSNGIDSVMSLIFDRLKSDDEQTILNSLHSLTVLDLTEDDWYKYEAALLHEVNSKKNHDSDAVRITTLNVLVAFYKYHNALEDYIVTLSKVGQGNYQLGITDILWLHSKEFCLKPWYRQALLNISTWDNNVPAIDTHVGYILSTLIENNVTLFIDYLNAWIENPENHIEKVNIFRNAIVEFFTDHPDKARKWLTLSLLSPNPRFHMSVQHIISNLWISNYKSFTLDKGIVSSLSFRHIQYLLFKIMGYVYNKEALETLAFSILERSPEDDQITNLVANAFTQHITFNYGGSLTFLKEQLPTATEAQKKLIEQVVAAGEKYNIHLRPIRHINELKLANSGGVNFVKAKMKRMSESMKKHRDEYSKNSFTRFFTNISVKGGKGFFGKYEGPYSPPSQMGTISSSFEMPVGEAIDPIQERMNLMFWRNYKYPS